MPIFYEFAEELHRDDFVDFTGWYHEGVGSLGRAPDGGMRLYCLGSRQGREGCMAFFRPDLPDRIAIEYDLTVRSTGGLVINYLAMRGLKGEDLIEDRDKLPPRTCIMSDYTKTPMGLQSYHVSVSRFDDAGRHAGTSNWRRNPGGRLIGHGLDPINRINHTFHMQLIKDGGSCQLFVDGRFAHGFVDYAEQFGPIPDHGKFGFRVVGADVMADVHHLRVRRLGTKTS